MKVEITKPCGVRGKRLKTGQTVDLAEEDAKLLLSYQKARPATSKSEGGKTAGGDGDEK